MLYLPREEGQGLVEYALILVLVAIIVIAILMVLGPQIVMSSAGSPVACRPLAKDRATTTLV